MQLAAGEGRQAGRQRRIDHADAQARAAALSARPADHTPRIIRRRQRNDLGRLGLIGSVEAVDVRRQLRIARMEQGHPLARIKTGRRGELQHRKAEGGERPRLDQAKSEALDPGEGLGTAAQHHDLARLEPAPSLATGVGVRRRRCWCGPARRRSEHLAPLPWLPPLFPFPFPLPWPLPFPLPWPLPSPLPLPCRSHCRCRCHSLPLPFPLPFPPPLPFPFPWPPSAARAGATRR